jgi:hypothetical protein
MMENEALTPAFLSHLVEVGPDFFTEEIAAEAIGGMNVTSGPNQEDS